MSMLDRTFVADAAESASDSLVLVVPKGVRNTTAQGSGFVVNALGVPRILTSAHVAAGGMTVEVAFSKDGYTERHNATVVGRAPGGEDLALLDLDGGKAIDCPALTLGDSDALRLGEFVIALGHPSGLRGAVTLGVVSGKVTLPVSSVPQELTASDADEETRSGEGATVPYLVTDAAFAGGMSGGPLLDPSGAVVGVSTFVRPELRGLGNYAIASNRAAKVIEEIAQAAAGEAARFCVGFRVLLFNDRFNKRAHVEAVLKEGGLSAEEARVAMMSAHTMGRGVVRTFDVVRSIGDREDDVRAASEQAEALRAALAAADLLVEVEKVLE
jgi:S1-C subfamily serine protease